MKSSPLERIFDTTNISILIIASLLAFYPIYYVFIYSITDPAVAVGGTVYLIPGRLSLENYKAIFMQNDLLNYAFISISRTVVGTVLTVFGCAMFAYGLSNKKTPCRKFIYKAVVISLYISPGLIPWYVTMYRIGLTNNFLAYILPTIIAPFYVIIARTYFEQQPIDIEESATIDGAGYFQVFFHIILPISKPILATTAIFQAVGQWNTWIDNLYLCPNSKLMTLQLFLLNYIQNQVSSSQIVDLAKGGMRTFVTPTSLRMTMTIILILPVLFVYPVMQKYFVKGLMLGAIKG